MPVHDNLMELYYKSYLILLSIIAILPLCLSGVLFAFEINCNKLRIVIKNKDCESWLLNRLVCYVYIDKMRSEKNDDENYANAESYESFESYIFKYLNHLNVAVRISVRKLWCMNIYCFISKSSLRATMLIYLVWSGTIKIVRMIKISLPLNRIFSFSFSSHWMKSVGPLLHNCIRLLQVLLLTTIYFFSFILSSEFESGYKAVLIDDSNWMMN